MQSLRAAGESVLNILYPPRCPVCDGIVPWGKDICPACEKKLPYITTCRCVKCGKPVEAGRPLCDDCMEIPHAFDRGIGVFLYDDTMRRVMRAFKYEGRQEYGRALGRLLAGYAEERIVRWRPDALVPIPIHRGRLAARGYNQAEILARAAAKRCGVPVRADLLVRRISTAAMKDLDRGERRKNMAGAFAVPAEVSVPERVLIIDDIYTTGATVDAAAAALKSAGTRAVFFLTVCMGGGFMVQF